MRLVSMVPSITETLLECGFDVVGRTRYCIHPESKVRSIAVVGGTKDISWDKVKEVKPDLLILDKEENPKKFAENSPCAWWAGHAEGIDSVPRDLQELHDLLREKSVSDDNAKALDQLQKVIERWQNLIEQKDIERTESAFNDTEGVAFEKVLQKLPGLIQWIQKPEPQWKPEKTLYLIWKKPWIAVSKNTFIGSCLDFVSLSAPEFETKYPKIKLEDFDPKKTLLLFSSEPYPFAQEVDEIKALKFPSALVDGEKFSWFGVRSLSFLESQLKAR